MCAICWSKIANLRFYWFFEGFARNNRQKNLSIPKSSEGFHMVSGPVLENCNKVVSLALRIGAGKAGMREVVNHLKSECRRGNGARWPIARSLAMTEIRRRRRKESVHYSGGISQSLLTSAPTIKALGKIRAPSCKSPCLTLRVNSSLPARQSRKFPSRRPVRSVCRDRAQARGRDNRFRA
jgi:hypothetical protein